MVVNLDLEAQMHDKRKKLIESGLAEGSDESDTYDRRKNVGSFIGSAIPIITLLVSALVGYLVSTLTPQHELEDLYRRQEDLVLLSVEDLVHSLQAMEKPGCFPTAFRHGRLCLSSAKASRSLLFR